MRNKLLFNILIGVIFTVGILILLYPAVSDYINTKHSTRVINTYIDIVRDTHTDRLMEIKQQAVNYNRKLYREPEAFYKPQLVAGYEDILDVSGTGIMGYISIEKIGVELPIYHGVDQEVLQVGVGHLPGSSLPVGGESTHAVLSGHRGLPSAKLFTDLDELAVGDIFTISVCDEQLTYRVDQIKIVLPAETDELKITEGKDYCTLLTCTPYGINSHRLLVRGVRTDNPEEVHDVRVANEAIRIDPVLVASVVAVPLLILVFAILIIAEKKKR